MTETIVDLIEDVIEGRRNCPTQILTTTSRCSARKGTVSQLALSCSKVRSCPLRVLILTSRSSAGSIAAFSESRRSSSDSSSPPNRMWIKCRFLA